MANPQNRTPENVPGRYYVDDTCIDCDLCRETAPQIFRRQGDGGYSIVYRQPVTPEEIARAEEAREGCPTETIGNDGEWLIVQENVSERCGLSFGVLSKPLEKLR